MQEYQLEYWEMADEDTRMDQARRFDLHNIEKVDFDEEKRLDEEGFIIREAGEGLGPLDPPEPVDPLMAILDNPDPKSIWKLADSSRGKELLLKRGWGGTLDLKDAEILQAFQGLRWKGEETRCRELSPSMAHLTATSSITSAMV